MGLTNPHPVHIGHEPVPVTRQEESLEELCAYGFCVRNVFVAKYHSDTS